MINKKRLIKYGSGILIAAALITSTLSTSILQSVQSVFADDQAPNTCHNNDPDDQQGGGPDYHYTCTYNNDHDALDDASRRLFLHHLESKNEGLAEEFYLRQIDGSNVHQVIVNQTTDGTHWKFASVIATLNSDNTTNRENITFHTDTNALFYTDIYPAYNHLPSNDEIRQQTQSANNDNNKYGNETIYNLSDFKKCNGIFQICDEIYNLTVGDKFLFSRFTATRYGHEIENNLRAIVQRTDDDHWVYSKASNSAW